MKKLIAILMMALLVPIAANAQSTTKKGGKKEVSPVIEGKQKVRLADYDSVWKFTAFDAKKIYFLDFDYAQLPDIISIRKKDWRNFTPVMNYLSRVARAPMRICAVFAINPQVTDPEEIDRLVEEAREEALNDLSALTSWMKEQEMKNKVQINVARLDWRYWQGADYFYNEQPTDDIIRMGVVMYFGTKKIELFTSAAEGAPTFNDVKFFPNDATIPESYGPMLDQIAQYLNENDRLEVLLRGYSDNTGTSAYNTGLSRQRAVEVKKELIRRGIPEHRIEIEVKGDEDPIGDNNTYEGRIANNRVSVTLQ